MKLLIDQTRFMATYRTQRPRMSCVKGRCWDSQGKTIDGKAVRFYFEAGRGTRMYFQFDGEWFVARPQDNDPFDFSVFTTKVEPHHHSYKGEAAKDDAKRSRARRIYPKLGQCENCPKPAVDRHHKDGNVGNNTKANVAQLCRRCHMIEDGRLKRLVSLPRPVQELKPCRICKEMQKPFRRGRCHRRNEYFRRNKAEWQPNASPRCGRKAP